MDKEKALAITKDRINNLRGFIPENESEVKIAKETLEYLEFVKKMLEE